MEFDAVKARLVGAFGRMAVIFDHASNFVQRQRAGFGVGHGRAIGVQVTDKGFALGGPDAGRHRGRTVVEHVVADRADVPQLAEDAPARRVHCLGDGLPAVDLRIAEDAGSPGIALPLTADVGRLGDHKPRTGALAVIDRVQVGLDVFARRGPRPRQRGHHDAIGRGDAAQL